MNLKALMAGAAALAFSAVPALAETWDMPMAYPDSNFHTEIGKQFAQEVTERTGGDLEIVVHGGGSLFKGNDIKRAVQTGQAPIGERLMSALANENAVFGVDAVPFLATDYEQSRALYEAQRPVVERLLDEQNLVLLYAVAWPPQGLYVPKEINSVSDLRGLKFRAYNPATSRIAELTGMVPTQIEAAELSQAFATGVAEAMISSGATGYDEKIWEHVPYFYDVRAWLPKNMVVVNKQAWEGLDEETRQIVLDAAANAEEAGWKESERLAGWYLEELEKNGMNVEEPNEQLQSELQEIGETMTNEWLSEAGDNGREIIDAYRQKVQ